VAGAEGGAVTWVAEFNGRADCGESAEEVAAAMALNKRDFGGSIVRVERLRKDGVGTLHPFISCCI
jgi:hypothetical protein